MSTDDETALSVRLDDHDADGQPRRPCVIVLSGHSIGRVHPILGDDVVIGRAPDADISIDIAGVSRRHARITRTGAGDFELRDLNSTNGTFVEGERIVEHALVNGERIQLGASTVLKFSLQTAVEEAFQNRLYESAVHDHLTTAYNRRYFDDHIVREMSQARRHRTPLSLVMLDVDHFKAVNDTHGHVVGDKILARLGELIATSIRREDLFCRFGGEEFVVIMRDSDSAATLGFAERIRRAVANRAFDVDPTPVPITISAGVATYDPAHHPTVGSLIEAADRALYDAKHGGRNCVRVASGPRPAG